MLQTVVGVRALRGLPTAGLEARSAAAVSEVWSQLIIIEMQLFFQQIEERNAKKILSCREILSYVTF